MWRSYLYILTYRNSHIKQHTHPCYRSAGNVGSVGRVVIKLLRERDLQVRALVHRLDERSQALSEMGAELVVADLTNGADVARAVTGCKRMYFGMSISPPYLRATVIAAAVAKTNPRLRDSREHLSNDSFPDESN